MGRLDVPHTSHLADWKCKYTNYVLCRLKYFTREVGLERKTLIYRQKVVPHRCLVLVWEGNPKHLYILQLLLVGGKASMVDRSCLYLAPNEKPYNTGKEIRSNHEWFSRIPYLLISDVSLLALNGHSLLGLGLFWLDGSWELYEPKHTAKTCH